MRIETIIQWLGELLAFTALGFVLYGVWRGTRREVGRETGLKAHWLHSWWFYLVLSVFFFGVAYWGWKPLPWTRSPSIRLGMLVLGSLLYFPGMGCLLWARLTLGKNLLRFHWFWRTAFQRSSTHHQRSLCHRPPSYVRGLICAALGSLLIYFTWTTVFFVCFAPLMFVRAWREGQTLAEEFGEQWQAYCQRAPAFMPR